MADLFSQISAATARDSASSTQKLDTVRGWITTVIGHYESKLSGGDVEATQQITSVLALLKAAQDALAKVSEVSIEQAAQPFAFALGCLLEAAKLRPNKAYAKIWPEILVMLCACGQQTAASLLESTSPQTPEDSSTSVEDEALSVLSDPPRPKNAGDTAELSAESASGKETSSETPSPTSKADDTMSGDDFELAPED